MALLLWTPHLVVRMLVVRDAIVTDTVTDEIKTLSLVSGCRSRCQREMWNYRVSHPVADISFFHTCSLDKFSKGILWESCGCGFMSQNLNFLAQTVWKWQPFEAKVWKSNFLPLRESFKVSILFFWHPRGIVLKQFEFGGCNLTNFHCNQEHYTPLPHSRVALQMECIQISIFPIPSPHIIPSAEMGHWEPITTIAFTTVICYNCICCNYHRNFSNFPVFLVLRQKVPC